VDLELALCYSVLYPVESHVHGFGSSDFGPFVGEFVCCGVVCSDSGGFELFSSDFFEDIADVCGFLAIME
jgi:hypothetical protein